MPRPKREEVREFILRGVPEHPRDIGAAVSQRFGISRQATARHLRDLVADGTLQAEGNTRARTYELVVEATAIELAVDATLEEDRVWRQQVRPLLDGLPQNVLNILQYGFTEMLNNVIDHSGSDTASIYVNRTPSKVTLGVWDSGIGIFNKLQQDLGLEDPRHALLELSKGKVTSDPAKHTGEGVFFTSRMFDGFSILSGVLFYGRRNEDEGLLIETEDWADPVEGTMVDMEISAFAARTTAEVFGRYTSDSEGFSRTVVPIKLARYEGEQLVSRSQAKRLMARVDRFTDVVLDFEGVESIGPAFADEMLRVFPYNHAELQLHVTNATPQVLAMIDRVMAN